MPMIPLPQPPAGAPPPGPAMGGGMPMPMQGAPMMGGAPGMPIPLPPTPAEQAGQAAAALVPQQAMEAQQQQQAQWQQVLAALAQQLQGAPNPAAEAAQGMPAGMVQPDGGAPTDPQQGGY